MSPPKKRMPVRPLFPNIGPHVSLRAACHLQICMSLQRLSHAFGPVGSPTLVPLCASPVANVKVAWKLLPAFTLVGSQRWLPRFPMCAPTIAHVNVASHIVVRQFIRSPPPTHTLVPAFPDVRVASCKCAWRLQTVDCPFICWLLPLVPNVGNQVARRALRQLQITPLPKLSLARGPFGSVAGPNVTQRVARKLQT